MLGMHETTVKLSIYKVSSNLFKACHDEDFLLEVNQIHVIDIILFYIHF